MATKKQKGTAQAEPTIETTSPKRPSSRSPNAATPRKGTRVADRPAGSVTDEQIRIRAYYLSLEREGGPRDPVVDWLRAERELTTAGSSREDRRTSSGFDQSTVTPPTLL